MKSLSLCAPPVWVVALGTGIQHFFWSCDLVLILSSITRLQDRPSIYLAYRLLLVTLLFWYLIPHFRTRLLLLILPLYNLVFPQRSAYLVEHNFAPLCDLLRKARDYLSHWLQKF